jgi:hypothetical protein
MTESSERVRRASVYSRRMRDGPLPARALRIVIAGTLSSGCALLPDMDGFTGGASAPDAGPSDARDADAGSARPKPVCTNGRIEGIAAFDATPSGAKATACAVDNALTIDDRVTGLDADDYGGSALIAGVDAYACVGVEFEADARVVYLRIGAAGTACGVTCEPGYCATGRYAEIYTGPKRGVYTHLKTLNLGATLAEQALSVPQGTRVVLACRGASSKDRDHVAVDAITAACP